jgi:hypothetical protein
MLGALARWLRICGYEAEYLNNASDEDLMERASEGGLVLLTKDRLLYRKASRAGVDAFLVEGEDDTHKLASVSKRFELCLDPRRSRCPDCGAPLRSASKEDIRGAIPPRTFDAYDEFWVCGSCGKAYWRGSHWRNIVGTIEEAGRLAGRTAGDREQGL